jgi:FlaA1/EpsC-like NDP-sugar epimerase
MFPKPPHQRATTMSHTNQSFFAADIPMDDLLERDPVSHDMSPVLNILRGKRVLVTGAGGSIGSEIVNSILKCEPEQVLALDHDETHLHDASRTWNNAHVEPILCDIRDLNALKRVADRYQPEVVFHAAAHKHVPILEQFPDEAAKTNVLGTANLLSVCEQVNTSFFVLISTDKAVDPTSAMGASKRFAELLVQAAADRTGKPYSVVRFGNVLGSRGSVIPTFVDQIRRGGPVTVSDRRMERYFMTIPEAADLVLQSAALSIGGETFVLDMGDPVKIVDLAEGLIRKFGLEPGQDIEITFTGTRPGEKFSEVLSQTPLEPSGHPRIGVTWPSHPTATAIAAYLDNLRDLLDRGERDPVRALLDEVASSQWTSLQQEHVPPLATVAHLARVDDDTARADQLSRTVRVASAGVG